MAYNKDIPSITIGTPLNIERVMRLKKQAMLEDQSGMMSMNMLK